MRLGTLALGGYLLVASSLTVSAASVDKSIDVKAPADKVWGLIGAFCAIKDWHPAIGKCTEADGVRTLVTKDGKLTFVEKQTAHDDKGMTYSYEILKGPLPISGYKSTLKVTPKGDGSSIDWSSSYTPEAGKEKDAEAAIVGIYQAGLENIEKMAGK